MPGNSGGVTTGTPNPGEIVQTEYWRLDNEGVTLSGTVEISLPIGERQPLEEYMWAEHPEKYDADGNLLLPEKGIVTFTLDTDDILSKVRCEYPNIPTESETVTARATEVCYSPLMTYITLELEAAPGVVEAYQAENGKGYYDEDGNLLWEYSGMDVFGDWICSLRLVDGEGTELFPGRYGNNGYSDEWAEFLYPCIGDLPEELYLAPFVDGRADLTQAVKVK